MSLESLGMEVVEIGESNDLRSHIWTWLTLVESRQGEPPFSRNPSLGLSLRVTLKLFSWAVESVRGSYICKPDFSLTTAKSSDVLLKANETRSSGLGKRFEKTFLQSASDEVSNLTRQNSPSEA